MVKLTKDNKVIKAIATREKFLIKGNHRYLIHTPEFCKVLIRLQNRGYKLMEENKMNVKDFFYLLRMSRKDNLSFFRAVYTRLEFYFNHKKHK